MKIKKMISTIFAILIALNVTAYGGVKYLKTWKNPEAQAGTWVGKKVVVYAGTLLKDGQHVAEEAMVRELAKLGIQGIPAYTIIPPEAEKDLQIVPPEIQAKSTLQIETRVYSLDQDLLVWTGTSKATKPEKVDKLVNQLVSATRKELKKEGLAGR
ncbi:MAG: hypothetical protein H6Q04_2344 [Acidobacteria bacterium]|nr:hypothetical protein [Acidobacteriota bacterium]